MEAYIGVYGTRDDSQASHIRDARSLHKEMLLGCSESEDK